MTLARKVALAALRPVPTLRYGPARDQRVELHLPRGRHPVGLVVLWHGGSWRTGYDRRVTRPLARDLVRHGVAVANAGYRRIGSGGGWPTTFEDVAAAVAALATDPRVRRRVDPDRVAYAGHSAGGHLALWAAARPGTAADAVGAPSPWRARGVVGLAPVTVLHRTGDTARALLGGRFRDVPDRLAVADPWALAPLPVPVLLVHPRADATVPSARSQEWAIRALEQGGEVTLQLTDGEAHSSPLDPASESWSHARAALLAWLA